MCMCSKPTINGQPGYCWDNKEHVSMYPINAPDMQDGDELLYDEPGRCGRGLDSHCHHFRVVKSYAQHFLLVRHGGGDERFRLRYTLVDLLRTLDDDSRYWVLQSIYHTIDDASRESEAKEREYWMQAAASRRIKTRKVRGSNRVNVTVSA
jgi:hypothetical protein